MIPLCPFAAPANGDAIVRSQRTGMSPNGILARFPAREFSSHSVEYDSWNQLRLAPDVQAVGSR